MSSDGGRCGDMSDEHVRPGQEARVYFDEVIIE